MIRARAVAFLPIMVPLENANLPGEPGLPDSEKFHFKSGFVV